MCTALQHAVIGGTREIPHATCIPTGLFTIAVETLPQKREGMQVATVTATTATQVEQTLQRMVAQEARLGFETVSVFLLSTGNAVTSSGRSALGSPFEEYIYFYLVAAFVRGAVCPK